MALYISYFSQTILKRYIVMFIINTWNSKFGRGFSVLLWGGTGGSGEQVSDVQL
jgi:hypothetical protein